MDQQVTDVYFKESPKCPTRLSKESKDFKEELISHTKQCVLLGEFPSVKGYLSAEKNADSDPKSSYHRHIMNKKVNAGYTYDDLQRHLVLGKEVLQESYELKRIMASQVVVYLLADLDRFWKEEQPHALPVMFFYRGYSLSMEVARQLTENCKARLRANGLDVIVTAADGEFNQLMVRGRDKQPLTQNQLMKDVWKKTSKLTKVEILGMLAGDCKAGIPVREVFQSKCVFNLQTEKARLLNIKTPHRGWTQAKRFNNTTIETEDDNEEMTIEHDAIQANYIAETIEQDIVQLFDILDAEVSDRNQFDETVVRDETLESNNVQINAVDIHNVLKTVNYNKWESVVQEEVARYLQSANSLLKLNVKELTSITKYVNEQQNESILKTSNVRKHELVNNLSRLIGDGTTTCARKTYKNRHVESLRKLAHRVIMKKSYPKKVLNIAYANYIWSDTLNQWKENARVMNYVEIKGLDRLLYPYYVPDRTETDDFDVFVYDKTHLGSNLRKCVCLGKVKGISKQAWQKVANESPEVLHPLVVEVSEDGKIIDQMKERYARNMFSADVEERMWENCDTAEARFCHIIREGLYEAEDTPGIPAIERCEKRLDLIDWLSEGVSFGDFPPYGSTIKGLSSILYEGLRTSTEAKLFLYAISKKGTYCVRAPNTLCSESFFSSMQEMDPWGQGVLTADGIEKHISDFTTLTALKMKNDRSFYINTKKDKKYSIPKTCTFKFGQHDEDVPDCQCRTNKFIRCIVPRDHYFDSQERSRGRKPLRKNVNFSGLNEPLRGDEPVRSRYGYKVNEAKDCEEAIVVLIQGCQWTEALRVMHKYNRTDFIETDLKSHLLETLEGHVGQLDQMKENFDKYRTRLNVVRQEKEKARLELIESGGNVQDRDLFSDTSSATGESVQSSRYSTDSSTSAYSKMSGRSVKNRRKLEHKKWKLKEGSQYEDFALTAELAKIIKYVDGLREDMRSLIRTLVMFHYDVQAEQLQQQYDTLLVLIDKSVPQIWLEEDADTTFNPVLGPNLTANAVALAMQQGRNISTQEKDEKLDPVIKVAPTLRKDTKWKLYVLET